MLQVAFALIRGSEMQLIFDRRLCFLLTSGRPVGPVFGSRAAAVLG